MNSEPFNRVTPGKLAWGIVLALAVGALLPFLMLLETVTLLPVMMLGGVFAVFLQCYAGWVPAALFMAAGLASTAWFTGTTVMWMLLLASFLPAGIAVRGIAARRPFFDQLRDAVIAYAVGLIAALGVAYSIFGAGMITQFMDAVRAEVAQMPNSAFTPFLDAFNSSLLLNGVRGMKMITVEAYRAQVNSVIDLMQETYAQMLPGTLLSGVVLSGVATTLWGNWRMARRGMATDESFAGMSRWFLPSQITVGALVLWLTAYIISASSYQNGGIVYMTAYQLVSTLFTIQAVAAMNRRMIKGGRSLRARRILLALLLIASALARTVALLLFAIGLTSALFGSHGAIKLWMEKRQKDHPEE